MQIEFKKQKKNNVLFEVRLKDCHKETGSYLNRFEKYTNQKAVKI